MTLNDMTCHIENDTMSCDMSYWLMSCHTDLTFTKFTIQEHFIWLIAKNLQVNHIDKSND